MPVSYQGSGLIPAPLVTLTKSNIRDNAGNILHPDYTFTLKGTIVNVDSALDSPWAQPYVGMEGIIAEQSRIKQIFNKDGQLLKITAPSYTNVGNIINAYCRVQDINFNEGQWVNRCDYTVILKATSLSGFNEINSYIDTTEENINLVENLDGTFSISHDLSAIGSVIYDQGGSLIDPVESARGWVSARRWNINSNGILSCPSGSLFNFDQVLSPMIGIGSGNFWNYSCTEGVGVLARSWRLNENFIQYSGGTTVREEYNATVNYNVEDLRFAVVAVNGRVIGFADYASNLNLRNSRAKQYFENSISPNLYSRILSYTPSGYTLNPVPTTRSISYERTEGVLSYSYGFSANSGTLFNGALSESIDISDTGETDIFASIPVPGRSSGPIIQKMNTVTLPERSVSINLAFAPMTSGINVNNIKGFYLSKPNTDSLITELAPSPLQYYCKSNVENYNPIKRIYSRNVSWIMVTSGNLAVGTPNIINNN